ncbi:MAG TPA: hypothetical protein VGM28_03230, partial [Candidatus Limnocylindrales bacterium]
LRRVIDRHEGLRVHGQAISVERVAMRAGLAALDGHAADAHAGYRDVLDSWRELGLAWDEAMTGLEMATVLDRSEPDVAAAIDRSIEIFDRIRARPFLERLQRLEAGEDATHAIVAEASAPIAVSATPGPAPD